VGKRDKPGSPVFSISLREKTLEEDVDKCVDGRGKDVEEMGRTRWERLRNVDGVGWVCVSRRLIDSTINRG
jgi:hypothetical protein